MATKPKTRTNTSETTAVKTAEATATAAKKTAPKKPAAKQPAAKKTVEAKKATGPKKATPKASVTRGVVRREVSEDQRRHYIEVAAYYIAERRGFVGGSPEEDWQAAEAEIDRLLAEGKLNG